MVRLEVNKSTNPEGVDKFQFQYGTIGSPPGTRTRVYAVVSIPVWYDWKPETLTGYATNGQFQFQYGTIGRKRSIHGSSWSLVSIPVWYDWKFRSVSVCVAPCFVSIPVWYDWKKETHAKAPDSKPVSIPVWYDWKCSTPDSACERTPFQFQYGTIGSAQHQRGRLLNISFNSSMVRLEVVNF